HGQILAQAGGEGGPLDAFKKFIADKDNKELLELLQAACSDEIFLWGGKSFIDFYTLYGKVNTTQQFAGVEAAITQMDPGKAPIRAVLHALQKNRELFKVPEFVIGFKLKDTKAALAQLKRGEAHLKALAGG